MTGQRNQQVRAATPDDLDAVVEVFLNCWRTTYASILPAALVASMSDPEARELWSRALSRTDRSVFVAADDDRVVGVVSVGMRDSADAESVAAIGWVHSLYVAPLGQGRGAGRRLLSVATSVMEAAGAVRACLWVFAANAPSIGFYARHGFAADGVTRVEPQFGELELRLARSLAPDVDARDS